MNRAFWPVCLAAALAGCTEPSTPPQRPAPIRATLDVDDVLKGAFNTFDVLDAPPNSIVRLFVTTRQPGGPPACITFAGGACLDIPGPFNRLLTLGEETTDSEGSAGFVVRVPPAVPTTPVYMQALGLADGEFWSTQVVIPTFLDPSGDLDGDGLDNEAELDRGTDPRDADSDDDGAPDGLEVTLTLNPLSADTDGGGADDGTELTAGSDPLDPTDDLPAPPPLCPAPTTLQSGTVDGDTVSLEVWTGADDDAGGCHTSPGGDATLRFTPPSPGLWRLQAQAAVGTVLSVRSTCDAVASELACHQPAFPADASELWVDLDGSEVTLLIERRAGSEPVPVLVSATPATPPVGPTIDTATAICGDALGVDLSATPGDADLAQVHLTARSVTGQTTAWTVDLVGNSLRETFGLPPLTTELDVDLEDRAGLTDSLTVPCTAPPMRALGETCDPAAVFDRCTTGACTGTCTVATAPTLLDVSATANDDLGRLGLQLLGTDPDQDVTTVRVTLLDTLLQPLSTLTTPAEVLGGDPFVGIVVATLPTAIPHAVSVEVVDAANLASDPVIAVVDRPTALSAGESCDVTETFGICPDDCVPDAAPDGPATCTEAAETCPMGWVEDLPIATGNSWTFTGDTEGEPWLTPGGTCGGAGPQVVTSFTAPTAGLYRATLTPDLPGATSILQARTRCASPSSTAELFCDSAPRLLDLAAGQTVHLIIAGSSPATTDGSLGAFTLTLAREL